ncbi:CbrC family protein [Micromonospora sp. NPDC005710]|uniref:CbrC family protein n=1 Tax=Micromonospora sp. NPDC005710 TaxID=3157051 RepID=UPI0033E1AF1A
MDEVLPVAHRSDDARGTFAHRPGSRASAHRHDRTAPSARGRRPRRAATGHRTRQINGPLTGLEGVCEVVGISSPVGAVTNSWHGGLVTEPVFRYHPDPLATGSAMQIEHECTVCGQLRQVRYRGPIYGRQPGTLCLHCIYSGEASRALGVVAVATNGSDLLDMPAGAFVGTSADSRSRIGRAGSTPTVAAPCQRQMRMAEGRRTVPPCRPLISPLLRRNPGDPAEVSRSVRWASFTGRRVARVPERRCGRARRRGGVAVQR